ncbi:helix-turn-helix transcriptional regulator [Stenotrophomonas sp. SBJS02]|nr:helix-turn-helix transcriptional regulator [Stenotrophomonas sp. SBJS02]
MSGLMVVRADGGRWVVPSTRAIWVPAGMAHAVDCIAEVHMRSLYVEPDFAPQLPDEAFAVQVAPLLRELLLAASLIETAHVDDSRDGRVVRLLLDELHRMDALPLHLPSPTDPRLQRICQHIQKHPGDDATLQDWAQALQVDVKTIQRHFASELGMTFGQWRQQARLLAAMERLAVGDKVIDVALAMGYDSPSAFTSMFKRQLGQTPAAFFSMMLTVRGHMWIAHQTKFPCITVHQRIVQRENLSCHACLHRHTLDPATSGLLESDQLGNAQIVGVVLCREVRGKRRIAADTTPQYDPPNVGCVPADASLQALDHAITCIGPVRPGNCARIGLPPARFTLDAIGADFSHCSAHGFDGRYPALALFFVVVTITAGTRVELSGLLEPVLPLVTHLEREAQQHFVALAQRIDVGVRIDPFTPQSALRNLQFTLTVLDCLQQHRRRRQTRSPGVGPLRARS